MTTEQLQIDSILARYKHPKGYIKARVDDEDNTIGILKSNTYLFDNSDNLQILVTEIALLNMKMQSNEKGTWSYVFKLIGPTGIILLILGTFISIFGWTNRLVSVGVAGLGPWIVIITDIISRYRRKSL